MVGFGLGFGSHSNSRQYSALDQNVPVSVLRPSALWNGTAGSGFAGAPPSDPVRTTAKPVCRLLTPPGQYFTDELPVGIWAGANNQGSMLDNLGLDRVIVHCEGASLEIAAPSFFVFEDANGNLVRYFGWWAVLQHPGTHGHAQVYFEAVPKDPAMQRRVIGPYQFSPQPVMHDFSIEVAATPVAIPGQRYKTLAAALNYLTGVTAQNPLVTITESFVGDLEGGIRYLGGAGYTTIIATVPVTFQKAAELSGPAPLFRPNVDGLWFKGQNITFDFHHANHIYHEDIASRQHVFEGVNFTDSGGRYYTRMLSGKATPYVARNAPWLLECNIAIIPNAANFASLVRGCTFSGGHADTATGALCVLGCTISDWSSDEWREEIPAISIQYTGAGAAATLELSGGNITNGRVFNAKVDGASVGTFTLVNTEAGFAANTNYTVANVATWIGSLPGWTASVLDNTRLAAVLSKAGNAGAAFAATDVKSAALTLVTMFDQHGDLWQWVSTTENVVFADNLCFDNVVQSVFLTAPTGMRDCMVVNNVFHQNPASPDTLLLRSQLSQSHSHVVIAHNTCANQPLLLRKDGNYNPDAFCLIANNVSPGMVWTGSGVDSDVIIANNHLLSGAAVPAGATGTSLGGTMASLFTNAAAGDFSPGGALLTNPKTPVLRRDLAGIARGVPAVLGALAGGEQVAPAITSSNPSGTYLEAGPIGGILTANKPVSWSVAGADAAAVALDPVSGGWSLAQTDYETKVSYACTFTATDAFGDTAEQTVLFTIADVDEIAPVLGSPQASANGATGASLSVNASEANGTLYFYVSGIATPPTGAALIAGTGAVAGGTQAVTSIGAQTAAVSGLAAGTTYYAYFLHVDGAGNASSIASGSSFTTSQVSEANIVVVSSAVVLKTTDLLTQYTANPFSFAGGAGNVMLAVVTVAQHVTQTINDLTVAVNGTAMVRLSAAAHSGGGSRPISGVFVATGLAAGIKTIVVNVNGQARTCTVLAMEVSGLASANLLANSQAQEGNTLTYGHSYTPTASGNLILTSLATRQGERGPFTPDAGVTELQDDSTGLTSSNDHSCFTGYIVAPSTAALQVGASTLQSADMLLLVTELRKA